MFYWMILQSWQALLYAVGMSSVQCAATEEDNNEHEKKHNNGEAVHYPAWKTL